MPRVQVRWHSTVVLMWDTISGAETATRTDPCVVTIGNFDGVHKGHQAVLARAQDIAREKGLELVAVTFFPHPLSVIAPERVQPRLTEMEQRIQLLRAHGADRVYVLAFDAQMAALSPAEFVNQILRDQLAASHVVVGEKFRFGSRAAGDIAFIRSMGLDATGLALVGGELPYSSTRVRQALAEGDLDTVRDILGRDFSLSGVVRPGDARGGSMGFPTANLSGDASSAVPADGVYAGWVSWDDNRRPAAISVGTNPTFGGKERRIESFILQESPDLYGKTMTVEFSAYLRPQVTYTGPEPLIEQMHADVAAAKQALNLD